MSVNALFNDFPEGQDLVGPDSVPGQKPLMPPAWGRPQSKGQSDCVTVALIPLRAYVPVAHITHFSLISAKARARFP